MQARVDQGQGIGLVAQFLRIAKRQKAYRIKLRELHDRCRGYCSQEERSIDCMFRCPCFGAWHHLIYLFTLSSQFAD